MLVCTIGVFFHLPIPGGVRPSVRAQGDARSASDETVQGTARNTSSSTGDVRDAKPHSPPAWVRLALRHTCCNTGSAGSVSCGMRMIQVYG